MIELYKIINSEFVEKIVVDPFSDEVNDLENFIISNEKILGNILLLDRQIIIPDGKRIDLWGIDFLERKPIVVELKNNKTGLEILEQILPYYNFVNINPDTFKSRILQNEEFIEKMQDVDLAKSELNLIFQQPPRIILVAPEFEKELLEVVDYLKFEVELIKIIRYKDSNKKNYIAIERPQALVREPQIVKGVQEEWNWEKYKEMFSDTKIEIAKNLKLQLDELIDKHSIPIEPVFRKGYIPYKHGRRNIMWIDLNYTSWETGDVVIGFTLDEEINLEKMEINIDANNIKWREKYSNFSLFFDKKVDLSPIIPIIKKAFFEITGKSTFSEDI